MGQRSFFICTFHKKSVVHQGFLRNSKKFIETISFFWYNKNISIFL